MDLRLIQIYRKHKSMHAPKFDFYLNIDCHLHCGYIINASELAHDRFRITELMLGFLEMWPQNELYRFA